MSGFNGMSEWEKYYEANRTHIKNLMDRFCGRSNQLRIMSNSQIAKELYELILNDSQDDLLLAEAAERLGVAEITETQDERRN